MTCSSRLQSRLSTRARLAHCAGLATVLAAALAAAACSSTSSPTTDGGARGDGGRADAAPPLVSSRSYKGHSNERDTTNFVNLYRSALGTRLDDCQTCHTGGTFSYESGGKTRTAEKNACDFCHLVLHPASDPYKEPQPKAFADTLNPYGVDYRNGGRTQDALRAIGGKDSDGDAASNDAEVADLKYPGDAKSKPGQPNAPTKTFTLEQLKGLTAHSQFLLANSSKQQYDDYASYKGVKLADLLRAASVDPGAAAITGVTVIAPDGFLKDIPAEKIDAAYPAALYYGGLDTAGKGAACGFVKYPDTLPTGLIDGAAIPGEQWLLLAYQRDGRPLDPSNLDVTSGKINGEGPLRLVVPQSRPGSPDRGSQYSPTTCNDGYDFDQSKDHNAGDMVRGVIAIRVNPLPDGVEDFDYRNGGWAYVESQSVLVYGQGITGP